MSPTFKSMLKLIAYTGLALSLVPALLVFHGTMSLSTYYMLMVIGMLLWFGSAVFWVKPDHLGD